jgi:hypothetical protein
MLEAVLLVALGAGTVLAVTTRTRRSSRAVDADVWRELAAELERARRYERPFDLIRLAAPAGTRRSRTTPPDIEVRRTDRVWQAGPDVYVLLPETDARAASRFVERLRAQPDLAAYEVHTAAFPQDGLTLRALLERLATPLGPADLPLPDESGAAGQPRLAS